MPYDLPFKQQVITFDQGLNTSQDPSTTSPGEVTIATGCEYQIGSPHLYKQPGRSYANAGGLAGSSRSVRSIHHLQYDSGTSKLIAYADSGANCAIYESNVTLALAFNATAQLAGLTTATTPHFTSFSDRWVMVNGTDRNYIREATIPSAAKQGYNKGDGAATTAWRLLGMQPAKGQTVSAATASTGTIVRPISGDAEPGYTTYQSATTSGIVPNGSNAYDASLTTYAYGVARSVPAVSSGVRFEWAAGSYGVGTISLAVVHAGASLPPIDPNTGEPVGTPDDPVEAHVGRHVISYSVNNGGTWTVMSDRSGSYSPITTTVPIATGGDYQDLMVRAIITLVRGDRAYGRVYDVRAFTGTGALVASTSTTNEISYVVTERFYDTDGIMHESRETSPGKVAAFTNQAAVAVYLPDQVINDTATEFVIYRSIDEPGGGYPFVWEIGTAPISKAGSIWYDTFEKSLTLISDKSKMLDMVRVLYPDGSVFYCPMNDAPPRCSFAIPFQGSIVYFPTEDPRRVWYSVPSNFNRAGAEIVPAVYNLTFETPTNDTATSGALTNGGRSLVVFFPAYSMLVNYLPQAEDPGTFDTRVREYVSETRGAAGRFCATSFSLPAGNTLAAAVDKLGLWVTDGVSGIQDWTIDYAWNTEMADVNLATAKLVNNSELRRLELLYTKGSSRYELHFFYGEMKQNGQPKITGPHLAGGSTSGWLCKHYAFADISGNARWLGWAGSANTDSKVFLERLTTAGAAQASDASLAYDTSGSVPFRADSGEYYLGGLGQAIICSLGHPKFGTGTKDFTVVGTFRRDGYSTSQSLTKTFSAGSGKKIYWQRYADRHKVSIQDISATSMPELVAYELYVRDAGMSKEG